MTDNQKEPTVADKPTNTPTSADPPNPTQMVTIRHNAFPDQVAQVSKRAFEAKGGFKDKGWTEVNK